MSVSNCVCVTVSGFLCARVCVCASVRLCVPACISVSLYAVCLIWFFGCLCVYVHLVVGNNTPEFTRIGGANWLSFKPVRNGMNIMLRSIENAA